MEACFHGSKVSAFVEGSKKSVSQQQIGRVRTFVACKHRTSIPILSRDQACRKPRNVEPGALHPEDQTRQPEEKTDGRSVSTLPPNNFGFQTCPANFLRLKGHMLFSRREVTWLTVRCIVLNVKFSGLARMNE